jgi:hypothetical protein
MHAAGVIHRLNLDAEPMLIVFEFLVRGSLIRRQHPYRHSKCRAPETGSAVEVVRLAIDDEAGEFAFVHGLLQILKVERGKRR